MSTTQNRRQSGLWTQNSNGFFSQLPTNPSASLGEHAAAAVPEGSYQYYSPTQTQRRSQEQERQGGGRGTFGDRSGNTDTAAATSPNSRAPVTAPALAIDPNYVSPNTRSKPWSPDPMSPQQVSLPHRQLSNASEARRRGSVPDRSPLQNLEMWSKDEKRARVERAEEMVGRQKSVRRNHGGRVVSDSAATVQRANQRNDRPRQSSGPVSPTYASAGADRVPRNAGKENFVQQEYPNQAKAMERENARTTASANRDNAARRKDGAGTVSGSAYDAAAERGKAAYERRKTMQAQQHGVAVSPISPVSRQNQLNRGSDNVKVNKRSDEGYHPRKTDDHNNIKQGRMGNANQERRAAEKYQDSAPMLPQQVRTDPATSVPYSVPPQTAAGQQARAQVAFGDVKQEHHHFGGMFHRDQRQHRSYTPEPFLEEWRQAKVARLTTEDLELDAPAKASSREGVDAASRDKHRRVSSSGSAKTALPNMAQYDGPYEEQASGFQPRLYLKCGPLLRYTGMRKESAQSRSGKAVEKEVWRGSVMIVTEDDQSDVSTRPVLRMFAQQMDLMPPPPLHLHSHELPPEYEDPVAGQVKLSRTGRALYVRPVHDIDGSVDLSREENNEGLYAATRTPMLGPQASTAPDGRPTQHITFQDKSRIKKQDGEKAGRFREVKAVRLHTERGQTFWRFSIEVELASRQTRVAYRINNGPAVAFWVPARGETMNIMFHSCNGFSMSVDSDSFSGPDPLWRDVLNRHQSKPFHVMLGGGDQIYNDPVMRDTELFREWLQTKNPEHKRHADFTPEMQDELEEFYLNRYAMWFSQGLFSMANSQIPMVNIWDDHDIIDGFGSYPHHFMATRVFTGLGAIAYKYYMLFQHQSLAAETEKDEPSWLLGRSPGPYINQLSRSVFLHLGRKVAFLGLDCRTERMRDEILSQETYDVVFDRLREEIRKDETKHLIVLLGVPIAYPRLNFLENILTSRVMDPIKALGRTGMLGGFVNKFDGGVEILDDLDDHWTAKHHKAERNWLVQELQDLAREKSIRITILGGDVHLAAVGQFYSNKDLHIPKDKDWRYMPNVISSAIVNTPPPNVMADVLNKRNKVHRLDKDTEETMIPMFSHDVDSSRRNNQALMPRRNFCVISEYVPGHTPPGSPTAEVIDGHGGEDGSGVFGGGAEQNAGNDRRFPPGSMKRAMSLGPMGLVRRLSGSSKRRPSFDMVARPGSSSMQRSNSLQQTSTTTGDEGYFPPRPVAQRPSLDGEETYRRPSFHRAPTDLSKKAARLAAARIGADGNADGRAPGTIDLEDGLDVSLCVEVDQRDPVGRTVGYRLLVPALWCDVPNNMQAVGGSAEVNQGQTAADSGGVVRSESQQEDDQQGGRGYERKKRLSLLERLKSMRRREEKGHARDEDERSWSGSEDEEHPADRYDAEQRHRFEQPDPRRNQLDGNDDNYPPAADALGLTSTGRGAVQPQQQQRAPSSYPVANPAPILTTAGRQSMDVSNRDFEQARNAGFQQKRQNSHRALPPPQSFPQRQDQDQAKTQHQSHGGHHLFAHQAQHAEAYNRGLSLAGPPIGTVQPLQTTNGNSPTSASFIPTSKPPGGLRNNPHPSNAGAGYRTVSAPVTRQDQDGQARGGAQSQQQKWDEYGDDGEDYYSDEEEDGRRYAQGGKERRGSSNAERFFGLVGGGGREGEERSNARTGSLKGRGWKVWK